jgi:hypothetical protein
MSSPSIKTKRARQVSDFMYNNHRNIEIDPTLDELFPSNARAKESRELTPYTMQSSETVRKKAFEDMEVPIYSLQTTSYSFKATISDKPDAVFAEGSLIGNFYTIDGAVRLEKVRFIGKFKGAVEVSSNRDEPIYFEGAISNLLLIRSHPEQRFDDNLDELTYFETTFSGFFKGSFYRWADCPSLRSM